MLDAVLQLLPRFREPLLLLLLESVVLVPRVSVFDHLVVGRVVLLPLVDRNLGCVGVWVLLRLEVLRKAKERADDGFVAVERSQKRSERNKAARSFGTPR